MLNNCQNTLIFKIILSHLMFQGVSTDRKKKKKQLFLWSNILLNPIDEQNVGFICLCQKSRKIRDVIKFFFQCFFLFLFFFFVVYNLQICSIIMSIFFFKQILGTNCRYIKVGAKKKYCIYMYIRSV